jgi:hypothetical protein
MLVWLVREVTIKLKVVESTRGKYMRNNGGTIFQAIKVMVLAIIV